MTSARQREVARKVVLAWLDGHRWYRAQRNGERVTLVSLQRAGVLERRVWRGAGTSAPAHEYRPSNALLTELARTSGQSPVAEMSPVDAASQEVAVSIDKAKRAADLLQQTLLDPPGKAPR
jgi:hypothetical protein